MAIKNRSTLLHEYLERTKSQEKENKAVINNNSSEKNREQLINDYLSGIKVGEPLNNTSSDVKKSFASLVNPSVNKITEDTFKTETRRDRG